MAAAAFDNAPKDIIQIYECKYCQKRTQIHQSKTLLQFDCGCDGYIACTIPFFSYIKLQRERERERKRKRKRREEMNYRLPGVIENCANSILERIKLELHCPWNRIVDKSRRHSSLPSNSIITNPLLIQMTAFTQQLVGAQLWHLDELPNVIVKNSRRSWCSPRPIASRRRSLDPLAPNNINYRSIELR